MIIIIKAAIIAGIVMSFAAELLHKIKFTTLDLHNYLGCLFTKQGKGFLNKFVGLIFHLFLSIVVTYAYVQIMNYLNQPFSIMNGIYVGTIHTFVTGALLPIIDQLNFCVQQKSLPPMGICAINYGISGFLVWFAGHIIFAVTAFEALNFFAQN